jgi:hypothetical protein
MADVEGVGLARWREPVSRRSFLAGLGLGGAVIVVARTGIGSYRAYGQAVPGGGDPYQPWQDWQGYQGANAMVAAAILAANAHNAQAWLFALHRDRIDLFADTSRSTGTLDPVLRELHVGLGCAIENLTLAARAQGLRPEVTLAPQGSRAKLVARIRLGRGAAIRNELYQAIPERHSNRGGYDGRSIPNEVVQEISRLADRTVAPARIQWFADASDRQHFGDLLVSATEAQVNDEQQSIDSFSWFRSTDEEIRQHRDGLTLYGQGFTDAELAGAQGAPVSRTLADQVFLQRTRDVHVATAAAFGVITVPDPHDLAQQLAGGRLLQRVHLWTAAHGLAFQHMNQITERADRETQLRIEPKFGAALNSLLDKHRHVLVSFRIGYPTITPGLSPRRALADVLR